MNADFGVVVDNVLVVGGGFAVALPLLNSSCYSKSGRCATAGGVVLQWKHVGNMLVRRPGTPARAELACP